MKIEINCIACTAYSQKRKQKQASTDSAKSIILNCDLSQISGGKHPIFGQKLKSKGFPVLRSKRLMCKNVGLYKEN